MATLNSITPLYEEEGLKFKSALAFFRENHTSAKKTKGYFLFDGKKPLLPQIEKAVSIVTPKDYADYIFYLREQEAMHLVKAITMPEVGSRSLSQVQASFAQYLYLLLNDSEVTIKKGQSTRLLTAYLDITGSQEKLSTNQRQGLMSERMKKVIQLWDILENRAIVVSDGEYNSLPSTPISSTVYDLLTYGISIDDIQERKDEYTHGNTYKITSKGNKVTVKHEKNNNVSIVSVSDIQKLAGTNRNIKALFIHILSTAHEQAIYDKHLYKKEVSFALQDLVDNGMYKNIRSARKGFENSIDTITDMKISGKLIVSKKKTINSMANKQNKEVKRFQLSVLFPTGIIDNSVCYVSLNPDIEWAFVTQFYTLIPCYYARLSNRALDLLIAIFSLIRQTSSIKRLLEAKTDKDRYVKLSYRAIQSILQLPSEIGCSNSGRLIKKPIEDSISEIEEEQAKMLNNSDILFEKIENDKTNITNYLSSGELKIYVGGELLAKLTNIGKNRKKRIEKQIRNAEKARQIRAEKDLTNPNEKKQVSKDAEVAVL